MKKLLRSTFGTLVVAIFLAMTPPAYARGGHGGGHGKHRGGHGGTVADMPPPMLRADIMALVFAASMATRAMQGAHITRLAAVIGEAGEVTTAIRTMAIPAIVQAITDWATAIHITGITVTATVGAMIHITDIIPADTILTAMDIRPRWASASGSMGTELSHHERKQAAECGPLLFPRSAQCDFTWTRRIR